MSSSTNHHSARQVAQVGADIMQENHQYLLKGIETIMDYAIFMLDPQGHIITWNEGVKHIKGYLPDEIIGKHFSIFYPQEAKDRKHPEHELEIAKAEGRFEEEGWRVRKDGSLFWANVVITALYNQEHQLLGFTKVTRDLTERKQIIDELEKSKNSAELLNKELEAFSYSVSHDLRAPLRSIVGYTQLLLEDKGNLLDSEGKIYLERASRSAQHMGKLIDGLLNLSRLSRQELMKRSVNLSQITEEILNTLQEQDPERRVNVRLQKGIVAKADRILIRAVLQNLLSNAWKFTGEKEEGLIEFGSQQQEGKTLYFIRDNGVGFDMEYVDKLFGAFQRLHNVTEFPGTGIGLATVQRIIHRHEGEIWAKSVENQGATFYFTL